jgi:site-specific recombinase XerD
LEDHITNNVADNTDSSLERKISLITEGLSPQFADRLCKIRRDNSAAIVDFVLSMKTEINLSYNHIKNNIVVLTLLSQFHNNEKSFRQMTREEILSYLGRLRKPENDDPLHEWIGSYNLRMVPILKFFKWLYYPDLEV